MDELELIEQSMCWYCGKTSGPLYINHGISGDRDRATTCLPCYKGE